MRKMIFLVFAAITVGSMLIPVGPLGLPQAQAIAAVPEPGSLILLGTGFAVLARYLRKR